MNDGSRTPKRTTSLGMPPGPGAALANVIKQRMADDPLWQHHSVSGAWLCPYCLSAVRGADSTRSGLMRAIESHLARRCTSWRNGAGNCHPLETIANRRSYEDIAHRAANDPAWQIFDHDGFWYSPSSLMKVPLVRLVGGRFDSFAIQNMVNQLAGCPHYSSGVVHPVEAVMRARDAAARVGQLVENLHQLVQHPLWRYVDSAGQWICPFCLGHIASVKILSERDWGVAIDRMAWHIACECAAYSPERPEPKIEDLVLQAAGQPPDTVPPATPSQALRIPTRSGGTPRLITPVSGTAVIPSTPLRTAVPVGNPSKREGSGGTRIVPDIHDADEQRVAVSISTRFVRKQQAAAHTQAEAAPADSALETPAAAAPTRSAEHQSNTSLTWMDDVEQAHPGIAKRNDSERFKARDVQKNMLAEVPSIPGYRFATRFEACHDISGDFYEFITLPDGRIGFAQGDVSGHGMHAGLIMSMAKKTLEIFAQAGKGPAETLVKVNDALVDDLGGTIFISMTYAILDPGMSSITWARAGHSPAVHYNVHSGEITEIKGKGMVVGMKKGEIFRSSLEEIVTPVRAGDVFLVYTDGVTETMNRRQEEYGLELLFEVVRKHSKEGPDVLLDRIVDSIRQFRGGSTADDDITLLAMTSD